jgi:hypothetical protein
LATIEEARRDILREHYDTPTPARILAFTSTFKSLEEGMLRIGASASWGAVGSVAGAFNRSDYEARNNIVIDFLQVYFDVAFQTPVSPSAIFAPDVTVADLRQFTEPAPLTGLPNPPLYIASVSFGRRLIFIASSTASETRVDAALRASFGIGLFGADAELSSEHRRVLEQTDVQMIVFGGSSTPVAEAVVDQRRIHEVIRSGANFSRDSPGVPITYTTRFLKNNVQAEVTFTGENSTLTCPLGTRTTTIVTQVRRHRSPADADDFRIGIEAGPGERIVSIGYRCEGEGCGFCYPVHRECVPWPGYGADFEISPDGRSAVVFRHCDGPAATFFHDVVFEQLATNQPSNFLGASSQEAVAEVIRALEPQDDGFSPRF